MPKKASFAEQHSDTEKLFHRGLEDPIKLYNHSLAPNPRQVRIFAAEKGINLTLEEVDILAGHSRTPEFLAKNSSGGVPVLELGDARSS